MSSNSNGIWIRNYPYDRAWARATTLSVAKPTLSLWQDSTTVVLPYQIAGLHYERFDNVGNSLLDRGTV